MNPWVQTWFPVFQFCVSMAAIALAAYVHSVVQSRVNKAESAIYDHISSVSGGLAQRANKHEHRLTKLESVLDGTPQRADFHELAKHLAALNGDLKALRAETDSVRDTLRATQSSVQRINDYLLNEKRR
jgi:hypothetical protein